MQISELYHLANWIKENIEREQLVQKCSALQSKISNNRSNSIQPFESERESLKEGLNKAALNKLTLEQRVALENLDVLNYLGESGSDWLENMITSQGLDVATAAKKIGEMGTAFSTSVTWANPVVLAMEAIAVEKEDYGALEGEIIIRVRFTDEASIENIDDFKKWADSWYHIGRGIAMSIGETPQSVKVVGVSNGSIIAILSGSYLFGKTLGKITHSVLDIVKKFKDIELVEANIEKVGLESELIRTELDKKKTELAEQKIGNIVVLVLGESPEGEADQKPRKELTKSVTKYIEFIDKGGDIEFVVPESEQVDEDEEEEDRELQELREIVSDIRITKSEIKRIGFDDNGGD